MRLSPRFVEWMMGLPEGWVTKVPGLSRTDQLKALGNGVVPQQLELAVDVLLEAVTGIPAGSRRDGHLESRLFPTPQVMDAKRGVRPAEDIESARQGVGVTRGGCSNLRERIMEVVDA